MVWKKRFAKSCSVIILMVKFGWNFILLGPSTKLFIEGRIDKKKKKKREKSDEEIEKEKEKEKIEEWKGNAIVRR